jgi:hypothetical protein
VPLLVVGGVLTLVAGRCAAVGYKGFKALTAPIDASNRWIDAVQAGDVETAGELSCGPTEADLDDMLRALDVGRWSNGQDLKNSHIQNSVAEVTGTIAYDGGRAPITIWLVHGRGRGHEGWCVASASMTSVDATSPYFSD